MAKMREGRNGGKLKTGGNNGGGRPRKLPELQELVDELFGAEDGNVTKANIRQVLEQQFKKAAKGDSRAAEIILNYAYGKPKQAHEHSGPDKGPIEVKQWIVEVEPEQPKPQYDPKNSSM